MDCRGHTETLVTARAKVAELVDALDLGSCGATRESSSLSFRTNILGKLKHLNINDNLARTPSGKRAAPGFWIKGQGYDGHC